MWRTLAQIVGLLLCMLGWGFVGCTLAMDHWRVAQVGGQGGSSVVVRTQFWSNLWKDCYEDSTSVVNCVDFRVLWAVKTDIHTVRGLLIGSLCLGLIGMGLTFIGLECTRIGGNQRSKDGTLVTACAFHLVGGTADVAAYCLYINRVLTAFLHSQADPSKLSYEIGPPLYVGLVGSLLILLGCACHCVSVCRFNPNSRRLMVPLVRDTEEEKKGSRNKLLYKMTSVVFV